MPEVTLDQARAAKKRALSVFSRIATVVGIGITRIEGGYAVKVNLGEPLSDGVDFPQSIDGVPIRIEVVGAIRPRAK